MKREELLDAIGAVDEEYLERSENAGRLGTVANNGVRGKGKSNGKRRGMNTWQKWIGFAACACLVLIVAIPVATRLIPGMGGNSGASGSGNNTDDGSTVFMSYAGPVFPMTALSGEESLTVERDITLDFQPWIPWWYPEGGYYRSSSNIIVEDSYTLTNTTDKEQAVQLLYPFVSSMRDMEENRPVLLDETGVELENVLHMGSYSGGFRPVEGADNQELLLNVEEATSWKQYKELLSDDNYMEHSLYYEADVSDIPVIVYRFTEEYGPKSSEDMPNPSIRAMFEVQEDKTQILSYGFNGGYYDAEKGIRGRNFSIRQENDRDYGEPHFIIVVGEDITNLEATAYVTGGWDTEETVTDAGVTISREETDMETVLREIVALEHEDVTGYQEGAKVDYETYYRMFVDMLECYGMLSEHPVARYEDGMLEFMDVYNLKRVCYLETTITIPAGESIVVTASMKKDASFDYYCAHTENQGVYGYDMVTKLGSNLKFTGTCAHIEDCDMIEIIRQNFGFDLDNGVKTVELATDGEHYYLEVKKRAQEEKE